MSFRTSFIALVVMTAALAGCSLFSPGYAERDAELTAKLHAAEQARVVAEVQTAAAYEKADAALKAAAESLKTGDQLKTAEAAAASATAVEGVAEALAETKTAISSELQAHEEVWNNRLASAEESAKAAGGVLGGNATLLATVVTGLLAFFAQKKAGQAQADVQTQALAPSRAAPTVQRLVEHSDELYDRQRELEQQLAALMSQRALQVPASVNVRARGPSIDPSHLPPPGVAPVMS